jgi:hypothetical protein
LEGNPKVAGGKKNHINGGVAFYLYNLAFQKWIMQKNDDAKNSMLFWISDYLDQGKIHSS